MTVFADSLERQGVSPALARGYARAFAIADSDEKRERIIDNLNLSHPMIALAVYGQAMYEGGAING